MIALFVTMAALAMFFPDSPAKPKPACPADTIYTVIYRHIEYDQPYPLMIDDSVHIYDLGVKP